MDLILPTWQDMIWGLIGTVLVGLFITIVVVAVIKSQRR